MFYDLEKIKNSAPLFDSLEKCCSVQQSEVHHPEGNVFIHSIQVLNMAIKESDDLDLIIAAMLHDIGKQINSLGHEDWSVKLVKGFISEKTEWLILNHMRIWYFILGDMKKLKKVKELYQNKWFNDLILLARWDKMGRNPNKKIKYDRAKIIEKLIKLQG